MIALDKMSCEYGQTIESTSCFPEFTSETNLTVARRSPQLMQSFVLSKSITGTPWIRAGQWENKVERAAGEALL